MDRLRVVPGSPIALGVRGLPIVLTAAVLACTAPAKNADAPAGLGRAVFTGAARSLKASPDGAWLAFLDSCREARGQFLPPRTANCTLRAVPAGGGEGRVVARAVTTLPQGFAWSPASGALAALGEYDYPSGSGAIFLWRTGSGPREIERGVTFYGFGRRGEMGAAARGRLVLVPPKGEPLEVKGARDVATFEFDPASPPAGAGALVATGDLLARRTTAAGGDLLHVHGAGAFRIASEVADYEYAPDGARIAWTARRGNARALLAARPGDAARPVEVAPAARQFAFSFTGDALAFVADVAPGRQGDLRVAVFGRPSAAPLAKEVGEFRWAARAPRLAWLEGYDPRVRAGTLGLGGVDVPSRTIARNVTDFELSPDGRAVAFLQHTTRGGYSVDLGVAAAANPDDRPATIAQGVFGFSFSPDGRWLYYRTRCTRNGEACDVDRVPSAGLAAGAKPEAIARGAKSFEFDPRDPERLLVGFQRTDMVALDVAVWDHGKLVSVDQAVEPGTAQFLGPDSRRLAYVVVHPKRVGVYVAELPR